MAAEPTGERAQAHPQREEPREGPFVPGPEATLVRLAISGESSWLLDSVPVLETARLPDGRTEVTLGVVSTVWLERVLLQLGPRAEVLEPAELKAVGREAAARVLARYATPDAANDR